MKEFIVIFLSIFLTLFGSFALAEPLPALTPNAHKSFDALINGQLSVDRCAAGEQPCPVKLNEIHDQMRARHEENEACKSEFRYDLYEIDCGADGVPELLIDYHGMCIYDYSESEISGIYLMIYRDEQGNYRVGSEEEYWERSSFDITERSFYDVSGSCGADCFVAEKGFIDKQCRRRPFYKIDQNGDSSEKIYILTDSGEQELVNVVIGDKSYYHFISDVDDKQILSMRRSYSPIKRYCPKTFRKIFDIIPLVLTEKEEKQLLDAAKKACFSGK